jgi:hypothetical protein
MNLASDQLTWTRMVPCELLEPHVSALNVVASTTKRVL